MGIASSLPATAENKPCDAAAVAERQRSFEFFESLEPGRAFRWVQHAWFMYMSGGRVERARPVFRAALARVAYYDYIYSGWTTMEAQEGAAAAAREIYEEWRARRAAADDAEQEGKKSFFWRCYLSFELAHGGAERARAVVEAAMAACPRDAEVRARCLLAELELGDDARARAAFDRGLAAFAAEGDADAERQLTEEVRRGCGYLSELRFGGCLSSCRGRWFRPLQWWDQL